MSERFTRLFLSERNLYIEGCPVVVEGSSLLNDNENNRLFAQLKFNNVSNKAIKSIAIKLKLYDNADRELDEVTEYTYLDISLNRDDTYGDKVPVPIQNLQARSFKICIVEVVFEDNSIYQSDSFDLKPIKEPQMLSSYFDNTDLEEQYSLECDTDAIYVPTKDRDLWICTCGEINRENEKNCHICGCSLSNSMEQLDNISLEVKCKERLYAQAVELMTHNDIEHLEKAITIFNKIGDYKDAKEKAEDYANKVEKRIAKEEKKKKKIAVIATSVMCIIVVFAIVLNTVIIPTQKRNKLVLKYGEDFITEFEKLKVGDLYTFGTYEQDNNLSNGKEKIEWCVLEKYEDKIFVVSKYALDCQPYNIGEGNVTWENSSIRNWLNKMFINKAFSESEREMIPTVEVEATRELFPKVDPGNNTQDRVFLLSAKETKLSIRKCQPTKYAQQCGAWTNNNVCWWLLRSSKNYPKIVAEGEMLCEFYGTEEGEYDLNKKRAIRPAMWIEIK